MKTITLYTKIFYFYLKWEYGNVFKLTKILVNMTQSSTRGSDKYLHVDDSSDGLDYSQAKRVYTRAVRTGIYNPADTTVWRARGKLQCDLTDLAEATKVHEVKIIQFLRHCAREKLTAKDFK